MSKHLLEHATSEAQDKLPPGSSSPEAESSAEAERQATPPLAVTIPEAARSLRVGKTTVKKAIAENKLRSVLIFGSRRIPWTALKEFAERGT